MAEQIRRIEHVLRIGDETYREGDAVHLLTYGGEEYLGMVETVGMYAVNDEGDEIEAIRLVIVSPEVPKSLLYQIVTVDEIEFIALIDFDKLADEKLKAREKVLKEFYRNRKFGRGFKTRGYRFLNDDIGLV